MLVRCDDLVIDLERGDVRMADRVVHLSPRLLATLRVLVQHAGQAVPREQLLREVWPDTHVVPNSVSQAVGALRKALAGTAAAHRIQPVPGIGYVYTRAASQRRSRPTRGPSIAAAAAIVVTLLIGAGDRAPDVQRPADRVETTALVLEAETLAATRRAGDLRRAAILLTSAIAADAANATAVARLAEVEYLRGFYGLDDAPRRIRAARAAADRALRIDPTMARAYAVRASIALDVDWDLQSSARDFQRALRLTPGDGLTRQWAAWWCLAADLVPEARAQLDAAVRADPFSASAVTARATFAYLDGDWAQAIADSRKVLAWNPQFFRAHLRLGLAELAAGRTARAWRHLETAHRLAPGVPETVSALAHAYAIGGDPDRARHLLGEVHLSLPLYDQAIVLTGLGQRDQALDALREARRRGQLTAGLFAHEPRLQPLHERPEFRRLVEEAPASLTDRLPEVISRPDVSGRR